MNPSKTTGALHCRVRGRVQGVGFRWFVQGVARELGLAGDVRNLADGSVEIRATGRPVDLDTLLEAVREGPRGSRVDGVERLEGEELPEFRGFEIRS